MVRSTVALSAVRQRRSICAWPNVKERADLRPRGEQGPVGGGRGSEWGVASRMRGSGARVAAEERVGGLSACPEPMRPFGSAHICSITSADTKLANMILV
eukprot:scaffold5386_cov98-Isochrysis_galbana.AAC.1